MSKIVWARDRTGVCQDRLAIGYRIEISDDGQKWLRAGDGRRAALQLSATFVAHARNHFWPSSEISIR